MKRTAVIAAMKWLEGCQLISVSRSTGQKNRIHVNLTMFEGVDQSAKRTGTGNEPVREMDGYQSAKRTGVVRETDGTSPSGEPYTSIHQEDTRKTPREESALPAKPKKAARQKSKDAVLPCPDDVAEQTWRDWTSLRKSKRAPATQTVLDGARRESQKAGMTLEAFLQIWCMRGSQGLQADWLKPSERSAGNNAESFRAQDQRRFEDRVAELAPGVARKKHPGSLVGLDYRNGVSSDGTVTV